MSRKLAGALGLVVMAVLVGSIGLQSTPAGAALPTRPGAFGLVSSADGKAAPLGAGTATPTGCSPWQLVMGASPEPDNTNLYGVSALSATDIWAAGNYFTSDGYSQTLIEHWDGTAWSVVPSPNPGAHNNWLFGIAATSANNAWAVGWKASTSIQQPLFLHWNGSEWTEADTTIARPRVVLLGISALSASDIWAVGVSCESALCNRRITVALHYDGTSWSVVDSTSPGTFDNNFNAVKAVSSNDVWAVGEACVTNGCASSQSLIEHWDGTAWTVSTSPSPGSVRSVLASVDAVVGDAWAVGQACSDALCTAGQSVALHWNGTAWAAVSTPNPGTLDTHLNAVTIAAPGDVWAVGSQTSDGTNYTNALLHWNGSAWSALSVGGPGSVDNDLRALARLAPNDIWAVGDSSDGTIEHSQVQHYTGPCGASTATPTTTATVAAQTGTPTGTRTANPTFTGTLTPTATQTAIRTVTSTATATPCAVTFTDVHPTDYFYVPVLYLACHGVISGYGDEIFRPYNDTTRGQLAKIVVLAEGWPLYTPQSPTFTDVPTSQTFYPYIETAYSRNIISGYSDGTFRPGSNVTRGQLSKIIVLARQWALYTPPAPTFRDVAPGNPFYSFIETAYNRAIISGYTCGTGCLEFRPGNNATRGQISKIVYLAITRP